MRFLTRFAWLIGAVALTGTAHSHAAAVAMLLDVTGTVSVVAAGRTAAAQIATTLDEGARVEVGAGGQVSLVHYATREQLSVVGPAVVRVTARGVEPVSGAVTQGRKLAENEAKTAASYRGRVVPGAIAMRGLKPAVEWVYPAEGEKVLDPARPFAWKAGDAAAPVQVRLLTGDRQLAAQIVSGNSVVPSTLALLEPGASYRIALTGGGGRTAEARFSVARPDEREALVAIKPADPANVEGWVLYAMALESASAISEAKAAWAEVARLRPQASAVVRAMAQ